MNSAYTFIKRKMHILEPNLSCVYSEASLECSLDTRHYVRTWSAGDTDDALSQRTHSLI